MHSIPIRSCDLCGDGDGIQRDAAALRMADVLASLSVMHHRRISLQPVGIMQWWLQTYTLIR